LFFWGVWGPEGSRFTVRDRLSRDERYCPTLTTLGTGVFDFLDRHFYREKGKEAVDQAVRLNLASTGFSTPEMAVIWNEKPVIMGDQVSRSI
jgi:hypothetical protein